MSFESLEQDAFGKLFLGEAVWTIAIWTLPLFLSPPNPICIKASGNKRRQPCLDNRKQQAERQRRASLKFYTGNRRGKGSKKKLKAEQKCIPMSSYSAWVRSCEPSQHQPGIRSLLPPPSPHILHLLYASFGNSHNMPERWPPILDLLMSNDIRSPYAPSEHKREVTEAEKSFWGPKDLLLTALGTWKGKKVLYLALFCSQSLLSPPWSPLQHHLKQYSSLIMLPLKTLN